MSKNMSQKGSPTRRASNSGAVDASCWPGRFKARLRWAEAQVSSAITIVPESSGVMRAPRLAKHIYTSLLIEHGGRNRWVGGMEETRPAQANFNTMSKS